VSINKKERKSRKKKRKDTAVSVSVGPSHVHAQLSEETLGKFGNAVTWLFPRWDAKAKISAAVAARVSKKIKAGEELDHQDRQFVGLVFDRQAGAIANQYAVAKRVQEVLPEVKAQTAVLPSPTDGATSKTFAAHAASIAAETTEEEIRDLFARVLAGEISRPGSFSLRTLETVRMLDQELASTFDKARKLAFDNEFILFGSLDSLKSSGLGEEELLELQDAGLVDDPKPLPLQIGHGQPSLTWRYQDRSIRIRPTEAPTIVTRSVPFIRLTRAGREIACVLPMAPDEQYFKRCGTWLSSITGDGARVEWKYETENTWRTFD
jgi:hypothetical protein